MLYQPKIIYPSDLDVLARVLAQVWDSKSDMEYGQDVAVALIRLWRAGVTDEETLVKAIGAWRSPSADRKMPIYVRSDAPAIRRE